MPCSTFILAHGFSSCGARAQQLWQVSLVSLRQVGGILTPRPGIKPMSPAVQGGFLTTGPPGNSYIYIYFFFSKRYENANLNISKLINSPQLYKNYFKSKSLVNTPPTHIPPNLRHNVLQRILLSNLFYQEYVQHKNV